VKNYTGTWKVNLIYIVGFLAGIAAWVFIDVERGGAYPAPLMFAMTPFIAYIVDKALIGLYIIKAEKIPLTQMNTFFSHPTTTDKTRSIITKAASNGTLKLNTANS
tara:strand:+ start:47 stop:364 length:318 start_codon:yes stop_codon:yes gene_type:complete